MSTAFSYALLYIARFEAIGVGAHWADVWATEAGDGMSIGLTVLMMLTLSSNITYTSTSGEKAGVSIVNVTKIYGVRSRSPKLALDNLSSGTRLGVCPQRDVLFPSLSAREHITLYAQLKTGKNLSEVQDEVQSMLSVLSLGPHADHPASALSGGTRRRLCVALAFVGRPDLVSLDEPAAGVDPAARRDIWAMILKLKEDRTVLLTTHHLDEAEFLSDQLGQIHTMGSPIEIKRSLGNGYKLTVIYPHNEEWGAEEEEERTKKLLAVVRDVVANAQIVDVDGSPIEECVECEHKDGPCAPGGLSRSPDRHRVAAVPRFTALLPSLFVVIAMGFSMIRPPADNELMLRLTPDMYPSATEFMMCEVRQVCNASDSPSAPEMMLLPDAVTANDWLIASQEEYIEKRYTGFSSALKNNITILVAWYNNKGQHALPAAVNALNSAALRGVAGGHAAILTYSHPLKISREQLSKSTLLQHVADAGISGMLLIGYSLVSAGAAVYLVGSRTSQQKRLQLLSGIIVVNIITSVCVLEAFGFPVFVSRSNLPAICLLLLLFG
ncbi:hypothetical protein MSG28_009065 [Choristoneura fumiferana]|uniref:Uncharacterized protein n=1 Tax=Choristoneura fumiferana TaxID=7141 RepID=A0ACC0KWL6_CHOFU|nr:hypothetical protein MSG28_009065 [Choristoneura fumiferana]